MCSCHVTCLRIWQAITVQVIFVVLILFNAAPTVAADLPQCAKGLVPVVKVEPQIPLPAGGPRPFDEWVTVQLIVGTDGRPDDPSVVDSSSSSRIFEIAALRAVLKYKYPLRADACIHQTTVHMKRDVVSISFEEHAALEHFNSDVIGYSSVEPDNLGFESHSMRDCFDQARISFPELDEYSVGLASCVRRYPLDILEYDK